MKVYGILGWPVAHSRSPAMQEAALQAVGLDARYVRFPVRPEALGDAIRGLRALGVAGANVTIPHKEAVMAWLDEVDADARLIGAVNTITRDGDRLFGTNTDAPGLVQSLVEAGVELRGADVVVLGAGGAARAAVVGLARAGASRVTVAARRPERAPALAAELTAGLAAGDDGATTVAAVGFDGLSAPFAHATLLIQATSATLGADADAFVAALPLAALAEDAAVVDLVYTPRVTALLRAAAPRRRVDGLGMLLHQGALAFERWTGQPAPLDAMRRALEASL
ncbi:MAG: shikimate dehydrogenase [Myxococcales bacterium]|nr:shikimate dehydrogenase [Myxococcales bacterium]